ncbi:2TM domain-containing protein [uncultured Tenacibaculum sp.]|uniref:2TM domain-containing protein n=1 Tax=uncultured Tenacibaculum sp. TaxID=174713 RepID=UPI0026270060|nr:2TM domain-containing protein [uncultured Tenacibaculum sp.]
MEQDFLEEQRYLKAKKKVKDIKGFYGHLVAYILVNLFLSAIIIVGIMNDNGNSFEDAISNFGVYSTWLFWGIGVFFHWLGVFGFGNLLSKDWEDKKIKEFMEKDRKRNQKMLNH